MKLEEVKKYLIENKHVVKVIIKNNQRHGRTLWGYKYPRGWNGNNNFADYIYNEKDMLNKNVDYLKKDIEMINGIFAD